MSSTFKEAFDVEAEYSAFFTGGQVIWTSEGNQMLCHCNDAIKIIDLNSGLITSSLGGSDDDVDEDTIYCFGLSRDNQFVISAHKSGLIKLWSLPDNKVVKMWRSIHKGPIAKITFDGVGNTVATGGSDGTAKTWDILHQTCTHSFKGAQGVFSILVFHPDISKNVLFGSADDTKIIAWDVDKGIEIASYSGHFSKITSLNFTIDGNHMVSSGRDRVLILWDIKEGKAIRTLPVYECVEDSVILPIKFQLPGIKIKKSDGGIFVASAGDKGVIKVWDILSSKLIYTQTNSFVTAANDGNLAITQLLLNEVRCCLSVISSDHNIIIYNLSNFECSRQMVGFTDEILDISYFGKDDTHIAVATNSIDIKVYDLSTMNCQLVKGHGDLVLSLAKSPFNPNILLSSSKDNTIRMWLMDSDSKKIHCVAIGNRHTASVGSVCLPYLDLTVCFSVSQDSCIKRWQLPNTLNVDETQTLISTHTETAHSKDINHVSISPNDKIVASGSQDKTIKLWSSEDLSLLGTLKGHKRGIWCVKFSPVDQVLLSASADCSIKLWSLTELNCLKTLEGHSSSVLKADFISKGLQIVSAGADGLLKVWNIKTSESVLSLDKHDGRVWALAISESENNIISGGADSLLVKWKDVTAEKKEKETKEYEELVLQEQELSNLLHDKKMVKALKLALRLNKPFLTLKIVNEILKSDGKSTVASTIKQLNQDQRESLAKCCIEWNTNTRNCYPAQVILNVLLSENESGFNSPATIRALLPYTQRHMQRLTSTLQDLNLLTFTINCMQPHTVNLS